MTGLGTLRSSQVSPRPPGRPSAHCHSALTQEAVGYSFICSFLGSPVSFQQITPLQQTYKCSLSWIHVLCRFTLQLVKQQTHFTVHKLSLDSCSTSLPKLLQLRAAAHVTCPELPLPLCLSPISGIYFLCRSTCIAPRRQSLVLALANHQYRCVKRDSQMLIAFIA